MAKTYNSESKVQFKAQQLLKWWMISILAVATLAAINRAVAAEGSTSTAPAQAIKSEAAIKPVGGFKSQADNRRLREVQNPNGQRSYFKFEAYLGARANSGWGGYFMLSEFARNYGNSAKNQFSPNDPSLNLIHPDLYKGSNFKLSGYLRQYLPVSDFSTKWQLYQTAYYSNLVGTFEKRREFGNFATLRYFSQPSYAPGHTRTFLEDRTTFSMRGGNYLRAGFGQYTQIEWHPGTNTGTTVDLFPYLDILMSESTYFSARYYMPIYVNGEVYDAAKEATLRESIAQVYFQTVL